MKKHINENFLPPVIAIDGPGGTGKGTVSEIIAKKLGWHYLDSGAIYRLLAHAGLQAGIDLNNERQLEDLAYRLKIEFIERNGSMRIYLFDQDVTEAIRSETCNIACSCNFSYFIIQQICHIYVARFIYT